MTDVLTKDDRREPAATASPSAGNRTGARRAAGTSAVTGFARRRSVRMIGLAISAALLAFAVLLSLAVGSKPIPFGTVIRAFTDFDGSNDHLVVRELRLPRTVVGVLVGAALGMAGALMQAITRNPLADPGLLGVNAGAALAVVIGIAVFDLGSLTAYVWLAFVGAMVAAVAVYALGSIGRGGATPVRLALAGAALSALLGSFTSAFTLLDRDVLDQFRFWSVGSLSGRDEALMFQVLPFIAVGLLLGLGCARPLNSLGLGEDAARALGTSVGWTRAATALSVTLLCGAATAACGPIGFVGLVVPLAARVVTGPDQRWLLPYSAVLGPVVLLTCDVVGRIIARPGEVQVGIMTAALGGPAFVVLVRRVRMAQL
jgi:iron complex transport system permease protein